jgi:glycosyltransferase involved in cell wall biosynthesis
LTKQDKRVRVLLNALHAKSGGGITYLRNMLPRLALDDRLDLHLLIHEDQHLLFAPFPRAITVHEVNFKQSFWRRMFWEQLRVPGLARRLDIDATFSPANYGPLLAPGLVVLLRNAVEVGRTESRPLKRLYWIALGIMTALSVARSRRVIAVSDYAGKTLSFGLVKKSTQKLTVVHHGIDPSFTPSSVKQADPPFLLAVGDLYVQKNFERLIEAFAQVAESSLELRLKIAGRPIDEEYRQRLLATVERFELVDMVDFMGGVDRETLVTLYQTCRVFVFPSLVETFGQPLVEAMACGAPIVSSRTAAMPEIASNAALFCDPSNAGDMAEKITMLMDDQMLSRDLAERGLQRARNFSWDDTARRTADILISAA